MTINEEAFDKSKQLFTCLQCGECCRNWKFDEVLASNYFGEFEQNWKKNNIYVLSKPENPGLLLWEWEKKRIEQILGEGKYAIEPYYAVYDNLSVQPLVFTWSIIGERCPFQQDNKCSIYEIRPIYCRAFPISYSQVRKKLSAAGYCKNNDIEQNIIKQFQKLEEIEVGELSSDSGFYQLYLYAKRASEIPFLIVALLNRLEDNRLFIRDFSRTPEEIRESIEQNDYMNLFEYLTDTGVLPVDEYLGLWDYFMDTSESK